MESKLLELAAYAILIHENFNRPPILRWAERNLPFLRSRTVGIMQVASPAKLSDYESVERGVALLNQFRAEAISEHPEVSGNEWFFVERTVAKYNRDSRYVAAVQEIMETLAHQVLTEYRVTVEAAMRDRWEAFAAE
jgi:hypothetical protein